MIIGLTGGIASGKSLASAYLAEQGYAIVDCDVLAREIMQPGQPTLAAVANHFGPEILTADGTLDRGALAQIIFHDAAARQWLDSRAHPAIAALAEEKFADLAKDHALIFFVVPLLFESGMDKLCDETWLVHAEDSVRKKRLAARDQIDGDYAAKKIASQMPEAERLARATRVLKNDGEPEALYAQIDDFLKKM
ncbi:MAG: dephospho-CoA kinase [Peptococcaceae bacterium]|nr:dephospho-CoA kinase [Peptococcaceae bacterium]